MTTKHTPGPWKQGERGWILDASGHMVTKEAVIQCAEERDRLRAVNAELVAAITLMIGDYRDARLAFTGHEVETPNMAAASAALAKAKAAA